MPRFTRESTPWLESYRVVDLNQVPITRSGLGGKEKKKKVEVFLEKNVNVL